MTRAGCFRREEKLFPVISLQSRSNLDVTTFIVCTFPELVISMTIVAPFVLSLFECFVSLLHVTRSLYPRNLQFFQKRANIRSLTFICNSVASAARISHLATAAIYNKIFFRRFEKEINVSYFRIISFKFHLESLRRYRHMAFQL